MMKNNKIYVWAHRGASGYAPENTLASFEKAVEQHADGIELDVQMTKDGQLVVIHDETIERVCDGTGYVRDYTWQELQRFNCNQAFPEYGVQRIPLLAQVLELIRPTALTVNIELKTGIIPYENIEEKTVALVRDCKMQGRAIYSSFNHYSALKVRQIDPYANVGLLHEDGIYEAGAYAAGLGVQALHPSVYRLQDPGYMEQAKAHGLDVNVWTVNDRRQMEQMCDCGVHAIITNYPDIAHDMVSAYL